MVLESLKRIFRFSREAKQEELESSFNRIDEEIDDFEKEIQEYLKSTKQRDMPPAPEGASTLSQGGAVKMTGSLIEGPKVAPKEDG